MLSNKPTVQISIVTYNNSISIKPCLLSALYQDYSNIKICIWDNNSQDETISIIKKVSEESGVNIFLKENNENTGFARAHNELIRSSEADYILCLNSDVILEKNYVSKALNDFSEDDVGSVQGKLLRYDFKKMEPVKKDDKNIIDTTGLKMTKVRKAFNVGSGEADEGQYREKKEVFGADGAAPLFSKKALEDTKVRINGKCEYFDEDFYIYKEDVDLAWRMRLFGWKTIYDPECVGFHGRSAEDFKPDNSIMSIKKFIKHRNLLSQTSKFYSFKNQKLMEIKNELGSLFLKNFFPIMIRETERNLNAMVFENYFIRASNDVMRLLPVILKKRRYIMEHKKATAEDMAQWFK